jgi:hypothetical protein
MKGDLFYSYQELIRICKALIDDKIGHKYFAIILNIYHAKITYKVLKFG